MVQQMCCARWALEIESPEAIAVKKTRCRQNCDLSANTKSLGRAQMSNQFATVSQNQAMVSNQKVGTAHNKRETIMKSIETLALDEIDR
jgi:hypothetical protein